MSIENKIRNLIDEFQTMADNKHAIANALYLEGLKDQASKMDRNAHPYEAMAARLRLVLND